MRRLPTGGQYLSDDRFGAGRLTTRCRRLGPSPPEAGGQLVEPAAGLVVDRDVEGGEGAGQLVEGPGPRTWAVIPGRDSSQASARAVGVTSSSPDKDSYCSRLARLSAIRSYRALWPSSTLSTPRRPPLALARLPLAHITTRRQS